MKTLRLFMILLAALLLGSGAISISWAKDKPADIEGSVIPDDPDAVAVTQRSDIMILPSLQDLQDLSRNKLQNLVKTLNARRESLGLGPFKPLADAIEVAQRGNVRRKSTKVELLRVIAVSLNNPFNANDPINNAFVNGQVFNLAPDQIGEVIDDNGNGGGGNGGRANCIASGFTIFGNPIIDMIPVPNGQFDDTEGATILVDINACTVTLVAGDQLADPTSYALAQATEFSKFAAESPAYFVEFAFPTSVNSDSTDFEFVNRHLDTGRFIRALFRITAPRGNTSPRTLQLFVVEELDSFVSPSFE